ncbi:hypothetical protein HY256_04755 [Candidatus Sumerlaeota bacterium]|nr:hypothetical protein [Candidatus Sumerlaeota bacterium]
MFNMEDRIARLERRNRLLFLLVLALGGALGWRFYQEEFGEGRRYPEMIRARAFHVVDAAGKTVARFGSSDEGNPVLDMYGPEEKVRLKLSVGQQGAAGLLLRDQTGADKMTVSLAPAGAPVLGMFDGQNTARVKLAVSEAGSAYLSLADIEGKNRLMGTVLRDGSGVLDFYGPDAKRPVAQMGFLTGESPHIRLNKADLTLLWRAP